MALDARALILATLLSGCTQEPQDAQTIKLTLVKSSADIATLCGRDNAVIEGFGCAKQNRSAINPDGTCEIVAIRPRGFDDDAALKTLGHELWHCFHGAIHD